MATGKAPAYQMYAADFAMATMGWPSDPLAAHIRLMNSQWINDGLPDDLQELCCIAGLTPAKFKKAWERLESRYPVCEDGKRRNPRLESERQKQQEYREKQANAAAMRWHKPAISQKPSQTDALQSSSSSSTSNQKQTTKSECATRLPHDFKVTPDHRYWALERGLPSPDDHIEHFRDFWLSNGKKKLDWNATFRVWLINSKTKYGATNGQRKAQVNQDQQRDDFRQMAAAIDGESGPETAVPKQRLLAHAGVKERGDGGLEGVGKADGSGEIH